MGFKIGHKINVGRRRSPEWKDLQSARMKLRMNDAGTKEKIRHSLTGKRHSLETRYKISLAHKGKKGYWAGKKRDVWWRSKILARLCSSPNLFEKRCGEELEKKFPGKFVFVGDGTIFINGKSPDFIAKELGIVVLCHGLYWHLFQFGLKNTSENRQAIELKDGEPFRNAGYEVWFIWEGDTVCL